MVLWGCAPEENVILDLKVRFDAMDRQFEIINFLKYYSGVCNKTTTEEVCGNRERGTKMYEMLQHLTFGMGKMMKFSEKTNSLKP